MSKNILILIIAVFFAGSVLAKTPEPANSAPLGAEVDKFPFFKQGELNQLGVSYTESALGLQKEVLKKPMVVLNHFRQDNSWRQQTLPVGDEVFVEKSTGIARYRAACSNRIVPVVPCPACKEKVTSTFYPLTGHPTGPSVNGKNSNPSSLDRFLKALTTGWDKFIDGLGTMLGWLLPLLLLLALLYGLYHLFQRRQDDPPPAPPVVPPPTPAAPSPTFVPAREPGQRRSGTAAWLSPEGEIAEGGDEKRSQPASVTPIVDSAKPKVSEKPEVATGEFKILKGGKGKPTAYVISGCIVGFEKRADGSFLIREAE